MTSSPEVMLSRRLATASCAASCTSASISSKLASTSGLSFSSNARRATGRRPRPPRHLRPRRSAARRRRARHGALVDGRRLAAADSVAVRRRVGGRRGWAALGRFEVDDVAQQHAAGLQRVMPGDDCAKRQRAFAQAADHHVAAGLDALGDRDLALARQQLDGAHLAQIHAHWVVGAPEAFLVDVAGLLLGLLALALDLLGLDDGRLAFLRSPRPRRPECPSRRGWPSRPRSARSWSARARGRG